MLAALAEPLRLDLLPLGVEPLIKAWIWSKSEPADAESACLLASSWPLSLPVVSFDCEWAI